MKHFDQVPTKIAALSQWLGWIGVVFLCVFVLGSSVCSAQSNSPEKKPSLIEREAFDLIVFNAANKNLEMEVFPLALAGRRVPRPFPAGSFDARALDNPTEDLRIAWSAVAKIELYETRLMAEALRLTKAKDFNQAFRYFAKLDQNYPNFRGLDAALTSYLRADALDQFRKGNHEHALAVLQSLYLRAKKTAGVAQAVNAVSDSILKAFWNANDYKGVRHTLNMLESRFQGLDLTVVDRWQSRLGKRLELLLDQGEKAFAKQDYRTARLAANRAFNLSPDSPVAIDLVARIEQANPTLRIGVTQPYYGEATLQLDSPVARRTGRLLGTSLASLEDFAASGGVYSTPFGEVYTDDSNDQIILKLDPAANVGGQGAYRVVRSLLETVERGDPSFAALAGRLQSIEVRGSDEVVLHIDPPHPHPEALLRGPMPKELLPYVPHRWRVTAEDGKATTFGFTGGKTAGGVTQIEEVVLSEEEGLRALLAGEIQVLDNVSPWNLSRLQSSKKITLGRYRLPTLHCLILSGDSWLVKERESRRGLCYALARGIFIQEVLLAGDSRPGYLPLSGPFPAGQSLSDPLRYAYLDSIVERGYQPRLAALLMALAAQGGAQNAMKAGSELIDPKELPPLRLAHPPSAVARIACRSIQNQLKGLQVNVELVELDEATLLRDSDLYDLRYAEITIGEPMVDVWPMLGPGGLAGDCSESLVIALDQLNSVDSSVTMTERLRQIHEVAHGELPLIPLWQTIDHYAFRSNLEGLPRETVDLYQSVESWKLQRTRRSRR